MRRRLQKTEVSHDFCTPMLICGDALHVIPTLQNRSISLVVTSPPYADQRAGLYPGVPEDEYPAWMCRVMAALRPKLTDDGSVFILIRPHLRNGVVSLYVNRTLEALVEDGWCLCEELVWKKPDGPPLGSRDRPRRAYDKMFWFSKTPRPYTDLTACGPLSVKLGFVGSNTYAEDGLVRAGCSKKVKTGRARITDVVEIGVGRNQKAVNHPAKFPVELCEYYIRSYSRRGDLVLDPFCGSGATLAAAQDTGRRSIGIDIMSNYVAGARKWLKGRTRKTDFTVLGLNASDAIVFEFIRRKTVNSSRRRRAAELSQSEIAPATKLSRRTVIRALSRLKDESLIEITKDPDWYRGRPNRIVVASSLPVPVKGQPS